MSQSVYGLAEEGTQSQSPIHTPSHHCRKGTKEDVEKEVKFSLKSEYHVPEKGAEIKPLLCTQHSATNTGIKKDWIISQETDRS